MINYRYFTMLVDSARLRLTYERANAPSILSALGNFILAQADLITRIRTVGIQTHMQLTELELKCAYAGLGYSKFNDSIPPWQLPDIFIKLQANALPAHPLIDPYFLSELSQQQLDSPSNAVEAIQELLTPSGLSQRWQGVPLIDSTRSDNVSNSRIAICLHLFYPEMWPILKNFLTAIPEPYDIFISVPDFACTPTLAKIAKEHPAVYFIPCQNRGRDILPFVHCLKLGIFEKYEAVCKIHSKRSPHMSNGDQWLKQSLHSLLGDAASISNILEQFRDNPNLGLLGPLNTVIRKGEPLHKGCNNFLVSRIAETAHLPNNSLDSPFFSGTMFWFRPTALLGLRDLNLQKEDFPIEMGQTDGTLAHAIERLMWPLARKYGYDISCN